MAGTRRTRRAGLAIIAVVIFSVILLLLIRHACTSNPPLLTLQERQLVGTWIGDPVGHPRTYHADGTFNSGSGDFQGVWSIEAGRLTITYWKPLEPPLEYSFRQIWRSIQSSTKEDTVSWDIRFTNDGQGHILRVPVSELAPEGRWVWSRHSAQ